MAFYKKKPVIIEARVLTPVNQHELAEWCGGECLTHSSGVLIPTIEGNMLASWGDYIIKDVKGEFYPCKPDIFEQTYTWVSDHEPL